MFKDNSTIQLHSIEFFPNLNRHYKFWGECRMNDDNTWRIHVHADFYSSIDIGSTMVPLDRIRQIHDEWHKFLSEQTWDTLK